jgi:hypothetical protein
VRCARAPQRPPPNGRAHSFSELALLLPQHDLALHLFGPSVQRLHNAAAPRGLPAPVFAYAAPHALGGGTLALYLRGAARMWTRADAREAPDALLACNAGLAVYAAWVDAARARIPFAVTEYTEADALAAAEAGDGNGAAWLNPFHRPGQRWLPRCRVPNLVNGFVAVVVAGGL